MSHFKKFDINSFYTLQELRFLSLSELKQKPTLRQQNNNHLKLEGILTHFDRGLTLKINQFRLWFCVPDSKNEEVNYKVTLETLNICMSEPDGVWETLEDWQAIEWLF